METGNNTTTKDINLTVSNRWQPK